MTKQICVLICSLFLYLAAGCASVPSTHYYTFQPTLKTSVETPLTKSSAVLGIEEYEADAPYQQDRIVFRASPYEVNFYEYHRWLRPPTELVTEQAQKLLDASGLLEEAQAYDFDAASTYLMGGKILLFDQWYNGETSTVQIRIQHRLLDLNQDKILWTDTVQTTVTIPTLDIVETIKGFETAVQNNILQAIAEIDKVLASK